MPATRRLRGGASRSGKPKSKIGQMMQDWHQDYSGDNADFNALASGGDLQVVVIDTSGDMGSNIQRWSRLKILRAFDPADVATWGGQLVAVMVSKADQDESSTALSVDNEEVVRELRRDGKLVRGPWIMSMPLINGSADEGYVPAYGTILKPIVLKDFVLDREEDLVVSYTNLSVAAFASTSQIIHHRTQGFVRRITSGA